MQNGKSGKMSLFNNVYFGKKVLVTGDTGFKGSWLTYWLLKLGAEVIGYSLEPNTNPSHFDLLSLDYQKNFFNICDINSFQKVVNDSNPDIIFHLAAQPLVRYSYDNPIETYMTNVIGTANVLECARKNKKISSVVIVTTDKCYENFEQQKGYVEEDRMGGYDPYSSSKGCAELLASSYRNSYFNIHDFNKTHNTLIATARAGNVIGGGDWSQDRLIPDIIKSAVTNKTANIRNPNATRPWQHVLEPLSGYLKLGEKLLGGDQLFASAWNFGPEENSVLTVERVLNLAKENWDLIKFKSEINNSNPHEANLLSLNIDKAKSILGWQPIWSNYTSVEKTINWYKLFYENGSLNTMNDIELYSKMMIDKIY